MLEHDWIEQEAVSLNKHQVTSAHRILKMQLIINHEDGAVLFFFISNLILSLFYDFVQAKQDYAVPSCF